MDIAVFDRLELLSDMTVQLAHRLTFQTGDRVIDMGYHRQTVAYPWVEGIDPISGEPTAFSDLIPPGLALSFTPTAG